MFISKEDFVKMISRDIKHKKKVKMQAAIDLSGYAYEQSMKIKKGISRHIINKQGQ